MSGKRCKNIVLLLEDVAALDLGLEHGHISRQLQLINKRVSYGIKRVDGYFKDSRLFVGHTGLLSDRVLFLIDPLLPNKGPYAELTERCVLHFIFCLSLWLSIYTCWQ